MVPNPSADANARMIAQALDVEPVREDLRSLELTRWVHPVTAVPHRVGAPAIYGRRNHESWYVNGIRHRDDGPAVTRPSYKAWYVNGAPHRLDGPAWDALGHPEWYVNGHEVTNPDDTAVLGRMHAAGQLARLETVLRLWRPGGPPVAELADAVAAATS